MKYFFTLCITMLSTIAFAQSHNSTKAAALINNLFDMMNKHDSIAVASFFADSAHIESPNWEGVQTGKQAIITIYSRYFKGTPDLHYTITYTTATDDAVVVEYTFAGTFSNPEGSSPAYMRDKKYDLKGCTRFNIHNNKITTSVSYFDQVAFLRQVGFFDQH